ncbi:MAG TPA: hypothetical protein PKX32_00040 [Candidatus Saccharicenans sp.]|nr:hypothetical protein [Candidatus Saccharicenans sp.]
MGKKKNAPRPQSINISEILTKRFQNELVEVKPCQIPVEAKIDEERDYIVSVKYHGTDLRESLDELIARAKEEVVMGKARLYLHACRKILARDENNRLLMKELNLYYRLKSLKVRR